MLPQPQTAMSSTTNRRNFKSMTRKKNAEYLKTASTTTGTRLLLPPKFLPATKSHTHAFTSRKARKHLGPYERAFRAVFVVCVFLFFGALSGSGVSQQDMNASAPNSATLAESIGASNQHIARGLSVDHWQTRGSPLTFEMLSHPTETSRTLPLEHAQPQEHPLLATQAVSAQHDNLNLEDIFDINDPVHPIRVHLPEPETREHTKLRKTHRRIKNSL